MGSNCCVASREKSLPGRVTSEVSNYRNIRHSPSWSFRWDNRTHIEDIMDNRSQYSHHNSGNIDSEIKSSADTETDGISGGASPFDTQWTPKHRKNIGIVRGSNFVASNQSTISDSSFEEKYSVKSSVAASASDTKPSLSIPSTPSFKSIDHSPSTVRLPQPDLSSSRNPPGSPSYQLSLQVSNPRIPYLKSLNESSNFSPEGRPSFVLSFNSNELSASGSQGGSSDGWSMRAFSELMAASSSSQREQWSLDSEKLNRASRSVPPSGNLQTCRVCSKLLKEKSPWSVQKIVSTNELSVAAILVCGHVYHAECLETLTSEVDRYDPPCPVCTNGGEIPSTFKLINKAEQKAKNQISRRAVADMDADGDSSSSNQTKNMGLNLSMKGSFLKRHFSLGSRPPPARSVSETEATRKKKGFWGRYR